MAQRIDFSCFPGVREEGLLATMNKVMGHIQRTQMTQRDFREWLKDEGLWNKDEAAALLSWLDVHTDGVVRLGAWATQFFAAQDEAAMRDAVYKRLLDENTLLVKYVLEALDTEGGGRLHSTHELHRLLTSYVYPGRHIGLEPFKNWIKWAVVAGRVKLIGIRWGLTDLGKQAVPRLRTIDVDEFLEDERAESSAGTPPVVAAAPRPIPQVSAPVTVAPVPAAPPAPAVKQPSARPAGDEPDDELDLPPEAEPLDDAAFARFAAQYETPVAPAAAPPPPPAVAPPKGKAAKAPPPAAAGAAEAQAVAINGLPPAPAPLASAPRMTETPEVLARYARVEAACGRAPMDAAQVVQALREHGRQAGLGGGSLLLAHGVESRMAHNEAGRHLFLAALVARAWAASGDGSWAEALADRAGGTLGPIALLLDRPEALIDGLVRWNLNGNDALSAQLRTLLLDAAIGGRAIKAQPDLPQQLAEAATAEVLVTQLGQTVLRGAHPVAQFWLVREMVRAGLWTRPAATEIAFVPWRSVRLMAYRLRLVDSHFASGSAALITMAKRLAALLPAGSVEAAALESLAPSDHLRFDCQAIPVCQQPCGLRRIDP